MHAAQGFLSLVARLLIAGIFLASAVNKVLAFNGVAAAIDGKGIQQPQLMLIGAIAFLIVGSVSLIVGFQAKFGALLLLVFLAPATYYFHAFWKLPPDSQDFQNQMTHFMKNIALMGTMAFMMANGAGRWSIDARSRSTSEADPSADG